MTTRTLTLVKDGHKYVFRYSHGCEDAVVEEIIRIASDPETRMSWVDAAKLSFQITQYAASDCCEALTPFEEPRS